MCLYVSIDGASILHTWTETMVSQGGLKRLWVPFLTSTIKAPTKGHFTNATKGNKENDLGYHCDHGWQSKDHDQEKSMLSSRSPSHKIV